MRDLKYMTVVAVAAVGLALAGCGSSGISTSERDRAVAEAEAEKQKQIDMLQGQIAALEQRLGIENGNDPGDDVATLMARITELEGQLEAKAAAERMAQEEADRKAREAAAATAAKLYAGIGAAPLTSTGDGQRSAAYSGTNDSEITLTIDDAAPDDGTDTTVTLSEDKGTMVGMNHGWTGKRYADPAGGDSYEAVVYSDVKAPTQGKKFGSAAAVTATGAYQYQLTEGALPSTQFVAMNVAFTNVTRTAGTETFRLPDPNPGVQTVINIPGSYHGVSGTYNCTPGTPANGCSAAVAARGFTVSTGDTWTFTPSSAEARVTDAADTAYVSYGWWLGKAANDGPFTASAFVDYKGGDGSAEFAGGIDALNGTATYMGGAAGKYALASSTGGTNDAGHFTARATLEANFTINAAATAITGMIDQFMGADGMSRDWSVKLNGSAIADAGTFGDAEDGTEWTIGGTAAADDGSWSGRFYNAGNDGVPDVAAGTFHSTYGTAGRMVGAFGANEQ